MEKHCNKYLPSLLSVEKYSPSLLTCQAGVPGRVGLRENYYVHIKEASVRLKAENPSLKPKEILALARKEYWT